MDGAGPLTNTSGTSGTSGDRVDRPTADGWRTTLATTVLLAVVLACWAAATARYGGPDEPAHVVRAHAVAHGDLLGSPAGDLPPGYRSVTVPASLGTGDPACYRHDAGADSSCAEPTGGPTGEGDVTVATSAGTNPPLYYALVGLPARVIGASDDPLAYRLVAVALVAITLALTQRRLARAGHELASTCLALAVVAPSCWALWGVVNPNALEIALVALSAASIVGARSAPTRAQAAWVAVPLALAVAMRPVAALWSVAVVAVCEVEWRDAVTFRTRAVLWGAPALGAVGVVAWSRWSSLVVADQRTAGDGTRLDALRDSVGGLPRSAAELVASMGWLEYWAPWMALAAWSGASVLLVRTRPALRRASWAVLAVTLVVVPVAFEVVLYERVGLIWQGRYGLPVAAAVAVLALTSSRRPPSPTIGRWAALLAAITLTTTFWATARRAATGTDGSWFFQGAVRSSRVLDPGTWVIVHTAVVAACTLLLMRRLSSSEPVGSTASGRAASTPPR